MRKYVSFFAAGLGKTLYGSYIVTNGIITAVAADGRTKKERLGRMGTNDPDTLARLLLRELELEKRH
jgi:hypothetical protein